MNLDRVPCFGIVHGIPAQAEHPGLAQLGIRRGGYQGMLSGLITIPSDQHLYHPARANRVLLGMIVH